MRKFIWLLLFFVIPLSAQNIDVFNGYVTFTQTDTSFTSGLLYFQMNNLTTGAATMAGTAKMISGTDTVTTFEARLVMRSVSSIDPYSIIYDSTGWHTITAGTGDYIPAENDVTTSKTDFAVDLTNQDWWKPCIGIVIRAKQNKLFSSSASKKLELYIIYKRS